MRDEYSFIDTVPYIPQKRSQNQNAVCSCQHFYVFLLSVLPQHLQTSLQSCTGLKVLGTAEIYNTPASFSSNLSNVWVIFTPSPVRHKDPHRLPLASSERLTQKKIKSYSHIQIPKLQLEFPASQQVWFCRMSI